MKTIIRRPDKMATITKYINQTLIRIREDVGKHQSSLVLLEMGNVSTVKISLTFPEQVKPNISLALLVPLPCINPHNQNKCCYILNSLPLI